jgi:hypothetical protein
MAASSPFMNSGAFLCHVVSISVTNGHPLVVGHVGLILGFMLQTHWGRPQAIADKNTICQANRQLRLALLEKHGTIDL